MNEEQTAADVHDLAVTYRADHRATNQGGLITQLQEFLPPGSTGRDETRKRGKPGSRLGLNVDVFDLLVDIQAGVNAHLADHGMHPTGDPSADLLRAHAAAGDLLAGDAARWHRRARTLMGYLLGRWPLPMRCPQCHGETHDGTPVEQRRGRPGLTLLYDRDEQFVSCWNPDCRDENGQRARWAGLQMIATFARLVDEGAA